MDQMGLTTSNVIGEARRILNKKDFQTIGQTTGEGMQEGIRNRHPSLVSQMQNTAGNVLSTAKNILTLQEFKGVGERSQGIQTGISNKQSSLVSQMQTTSKNVLKTAQDNLPRSSFESIGENIISGLTSAISGGASRVVSSIKDLCTSAVKAAKKKLDINSPSRVFYEIGDYTGQGFIEGWQDRMAGIDNIIAGSMPDGSLQSDISFHGSSAPGRYGAEEGAKNVNVDQHIYIYSKTDDLFETSRKFRQSQREAAEDW